VAIEAKRILRHGSTSAFSRRNERIGSEEDKAFKELTKMTKIANS